MPTGREGTVPSGVGGPVGTQDARSIYHLLQLMEAGMGLPQTAFPPGLPPSHFSDPANFGTVNPLPQPHSPLSPSFQGTGYFHTLVPTPPGTWTSRELAPHLCHLPCPCPVLAVQWQVLSK